jgi:phosphoserine phosphatase
MFRLVPLLLAAMLLAGCSGSGFTPVPGFSERTNAVLGKFLEDTRREKGRKIAVFDGDGTVLGQVPHYLADECLYREARKYPGKKTGVIRRMTPWSNVSVPYVMHRVYFFEGDSVEALRELGDRCFREMYRNKIYEPMRHLISLLRRNGFEVWIVTASPEAMYQGFLSREFGIPMVNIVGVKSVVRDGKITGDIVTPVPQDHGKKEAVETFVQGRPLFVAGNSRGDKEMIEFSRGLKMIINPDRHVAEGQAESMEEYAKKNGWLIERVRDVSEPGAGFISGRRFGIRENRAHE